MRSSVNHSHRDIQAARKHRLGLIAAAVALWATGSAHAGIPYPSASTPAAVDLGATSEAPITLTVALKPSNPAQLDSLLSALYTSGSPSYHQFLSADQFRKQFAPSADVVAQATAYFKAAGLSVSTGSGSLLKVTGGAQAIQKAFGVTLHTYEVAGTASKPGYRYHAPQGKPAIASAAVAANVSAILGLDNRPRYAPHQVHATNAALTQRKPAASTTATGNVPGFLTVTDFAEQYNVTPLYASGVHGEGRTIAIVTLASFTPSDAFLYWNSLGLKVSSKRLKVVDVDGGPGAPDDDAGSGETTLDVEQSGGLAPAAKIVVYQAPNTDQAYLDAFAQAVNDNVADSISTSWGLWEYFDTISDVTDGSGATVSATQAFDAVFKQAAAQGQSLFAASGDAGAYDVNRGFPVPDYSKVLSVDAPASSPWITAAGGTTLPGTQVYNGPGGSPFPVTIPSEQVWGWSYLKGLCSALGYTPVTCGIFPVGGGGGVSAYQPIPAYQLKLPGIAKTKSGQSLIDNTASPPIDYVDLPAGYAGRNVPDLALNADPQTGYTVIYTSSKDGLVEYNYYGGTSFVAPQLNGVTALLAQTAGSRLGLLNFSLYALARIPASYSGSSAPLRDITAGDNWAYKGVTGYDQGSGVGAIDVANLASVIKRVRP